MAGTLAPNSADWDAVGDTYYRKQEIYRMCWSVADLSSYRVVGAPLGGPLAITLDTSKPIPLIGPNASISSTTRPRIHVHSSSGKLIYNIAWDHPSRLVSFGFTRAETLVALSSDGFYRLYPINRPSSPSSGSDLILYTQHSLGSATEEVGIVDGKIWPDGMVVMRSDLTFVQVKGWPESDASNDEDPFSSQTALSDRWVASQPPNFATGLATDASHFPSDQGSGRMDSIESSGLTDRPISWAVIPPSSSNTGVIQILVSRSDSIVVIDPMDSTDQRLSSKGPYERIVPSPNGKFVALLTSAASPSPFTVWVVSSDFTRELSEYSLQEQHPHDLISEGPPTQMVWCGGDTVIVGWDQSLVMIGPFGASLRYAFTDPIHLVGEMDGVRVVTSHTCEFISKVGPSTISVFRPGSTSPAAILFDALDHFDKQSARVSDEHIRTIKKTLSEAVTVCIKAAGAEWEVRWQERLLKAASFGKAFLDAFNPELFVQTAKILRVLNAVRHHEIGIPLTYEQYLSRSPTHLVYRLTARAHYLLALRITEFLDLSPAPVLAQWARSLIMSANLTFDGTPGTGTKALCERIVTKLKGRVGIGPADIAQIAWSLGKTKLSIDILSYESRPIKQIPLLMKMNQSKEALNQSIKSLDPDLLQSVLWDIRANKSLAEFLTLIEGREEAISVIRVWAKSTIERRQAFSQPNAHDGRNKTVGLSPDWELFRDFCYQDDRRTESACLALEESYLSRCNLNTNPIGLPPDWDSFFAAKLDKMKTGTQFFSEDADRVFEQRMVDESARLIKFQKTLIQDVVKSLESSPVGINDPIKKAFLECMFFNQGQTMPSLNETIRQCIKLGLRKQADKLKNEFKVPEKRYWNVKLKALVELRDWDGLENWAGKKSPIGFEPFVNHLLTMGCHREALRYVPKCEAKNRVELYVKCGEWVTAGEECADRGETSKLIELRQRCPNPYVAATLAKMVDDLAA
ncbi:hypothetical protein CROQUDRAFT_660316 [Cronartium quercuum f. sp. fusiforme G11]|uniref:Vacuolar protein sorting-associated protein 16 homolog n=1 Tax=Cronartium quercuum f. sp. fusiforme G11 TaxID=708437 RepID=A0A9P6NDK6_9BASI|nr:hypothetical protein CROQUDRAFT_660316 [Cronartium quercuum f. sp. fusiforme G11]